MVLVFYSILALFLLLLLSPNIYVYAYACVIWYQSLIIPSYCLLCVIISSYFRITIWYCTTMIERDCKAEYSHIEKDKKISF
jgi:hypothetical protein